MKASARNRASCGAGRATLRLTLYGRGPTVSHKLPPSFLGGGCPSGYAFLALFVWWRRAVGLRSSCRSLRGLRLRSIIRYLIQTMTNSPTGPVRSTEDLWNDLPALLAEAETNAEARDRVITLLYPELRRIAEAHMRRERRDHTLQATALVSEFFVHIARTPAFTTRTKAQFLMVASVAMRRLLVDYARSRKADKRGGQFVRVDIENADAAHAANVDELVAIDVLLSQLASTDPRMAQIVELRFFGGLTNVEIAETLGIHERTVTRDWQMARAWLYKRLRRDPDDDRGLGSD